MPPKKRFGQNFLTNKEYASRIIKSLELRESDIVVEIGPGKGILTEILNEIPLKKRVAIEIDKELTPHLKSAFKYVEIIEQDFLTFTFEKFYNSYGKKVKVVGNIPYNITSPILFHLLDNSFFVAEAVLMMQKEVAYRLIAEKNTKDYGILTVLFCAQTQILKLFDVKRTNFYPQPNVDSCVVKINFFRDSNEIANYTLFKHIVKSTFNTRRKMLRNSLSKIVKNDDLSKIKSVPLNARPENLTVADFMNLANEIAQLS